MHAEIVEKLEEYLSGTLMPAAHREVETHLDSCPMCSEEVRGMREISEMFSSFESQEAVEPSLGFYSRVMQQVGVEKAAPSFAKLFALNFAFGRRLVFASLLLLATLGGYLVNREAGYPGGPSPDAVMAEQNSPSFDSAPARDIMLVTLTATAYEQH